MCGIVGYVGKNKASDYLLDGLQTLEYRGYDSAGIAVLENKKIHTEKVVGRVEHLRKEVSNNPFSGHTGVGHTRWATHGNVTQRNSHPHLDNDGEFAVVHNGIIENYQEIRKLLKSRGYVFHSDTDTEVIPNLMSFNYKKLKNVEKSFIATIQALRGAFAIVMTTTLDTETIYAAKLSSPLAIGVGDDELFIGSDALPIISHTKQIVFLEDNEIAVVKRDGYRLLDIDSEKVINRPTELIELEEATAVLGDFPDFMSKEIHEAPRTVRSAMLGRLIISEHPRTLQMSEVADLSASTARNSTRSTMTDARSRKSANSPSESDSVYDSVIKQDGSVHSTGFVKLGGLELVQHQLDYIDRIIIIACGTSYYAGMVGEYVLEEIADIPVEVHQASEFRYRKEPLSRSTAVLVISQSGETADTIAALKKLEGTGILRLGIVNAPGSTLARMTDAGVYCHAGPEKAVASTKAFIAQVTVLVLIALYMSKNYSKFTQVTQQLDDLPKQLEKVLSIEKNIAKVARKYAHHKDFLYIGRRYAFPVALEGALKLKEISYIHAEGFAGGEMKHGPLALIDANFPTFAIALTNDLDEKSMSNMQEIKARSGPIIAVVDDAKSEAAKLADDYIVIPKVAEPLQPIVSAVVTHLFAYHAAKELGRDIDKPRNLAKSVTVE
jgi:glucosamine--fructose-6-phosphate aminotransferase (isomerizing)